MTYPQCVHRVVHKGVTYVRSPRKATMIGGNNERGRKVLVTPIRPLTLNFHRQWKEALSPMVEAPPSLPLAGHPERPSNLTLARCRELSAAHVDTDPLYSELMAVYARMGELLDVIDAGSREAVVLGEWHDMLSRAIAIGQEAERRHAEDHQVLLARFKAGEV